jgi:Uma2 family endonuclease
VEVVSADGRHIDRVWKRDAYAAAGIPCYWRVDLVAWSGYLGPLPVVVVRVRDPAGWREIVAWPGRLHDLPLGYARDLDGTAVTTTVRLDPGTLMSRLAADR